MRGYPASLIPDPAGGFTVTFRDVPEAITEGDTRGEALFRAEDALESALAMYISANEPLPVASELAEGEAVVPLSALGAAKIALYQAMREQGVGRAELARRLRWHFPQVTRVTRRGWSRSKPPSPHSACGSSSMSREPRNRRHPPDRRHDCPAFGAAALRPWKHPHRAQGGRSADRALSPARISRRRRRTARTRSSGPCTPSLARERGSRTRLAVKLRNQTICCGHTVMLS